MIWNCVEDRIQNGTKFGKIGRKIIFGNIFADRTALLSNNPIPTAAIPHLKVSYYICGIMLHNMFRLEKK